MNNKTKMIVLAGGSSTRMGDIKALKIFRGRTFLDNTIYKLKKINCSIIVVLGYHSEEIIKRCNLEDVLLVKSDRYVEGMSGSIRDGVKSLEKDSIFGLLPVDLPLIKGETIDGVIRCAQANNMIVYPTCRGRSGHPVMFPYRMISEINKLSGDRGAREIVEKFESKEFETLDEGIYRDIDSEDEYRELIMEVKSGKGFN